MSKNELEAQWKKFIFKFWPFLILTILAIIFGQGPLIFIFLLATGVLISYYCYFFSNKSFGYTILGFFVGFFSPLGSIIGYLIVLALKKDRLKELDDDDQLKKRFETVQH